MKPILQPTQYSCMACVVAMITGEPLKLVFATLGHDGSERHFRFLDCAAHLNRCGFHLGAMGKEYGLTRIPYGQPALLIVGRMSGKGNHAVYWTGKRVLDPEPAHAGKQLDDYTVREWWPVTRYED